MPTDIQVPVTDKDNAVRLYRVYSDTPGLEAYVRDATTQTRLTSLEGKIDTLLTRLPSVLSSDRLKVDNGLTAAAPTYGNPTNLTVTGGVALTSSTGTFISIGTFRTFRIQVNNIGANALTGFEISTRCHASADMQTHLNTSTHFTAPSTNSILRLGGDTLGATTDPTTLAASTGKIILAFDFTNFFVETIRIRASATTTTTLQMYWGGF